MRVSESINISRAYAQINALGGYVDRKDPIAVARDELLGDVLAILERFGACDTLNDDLLDAESEAALDAVIAAERKRLATVLLISGGATRYAFPNHNADAAIQAVVGKVTEARFKMDRLIASRAIGEPCKAPPTPGLQCLAMQERVTKNEAGANIHPLGPVLTAAARVDAADFQSGFRSSVAG